MDAHGNSSRADGHTRTQQARSHRDKNRRNMLVDHDEAYQNRVYLYAANRCVFVCVFFWVRGAV